jgi:hypothetical protein
VEAGSPVYQPVTVTDLLSACARHAGPERTRDAVIYRCRVQSAPVPRIAVEGGARAGGLSSPTSRLLSTLWPTVVL